ncbi:hypothetical protein CVT26_011581, partial [Gymnopilus dilepis]
VLDPNASFTPEVGLTIPGQQGACNLAGATPNHSASAALRAELPAADANQGRSAEGIYVTGNQVREPATDMVNGQGQLPESKTPGNGQGQPPESKTPGYPSVASRVIAAGIASVPTFGGDNVHPMTEGGDVPMEVDKDDTVSQIGAAVDVQHQDMRIGMDVDEEVPQGCEVDGAKTTRINADAGPPKSTALPHRHDVASKSTSGEIQPSLNGSAHVQIPPNPQAQSSGDPFTVNGIGFVFPADSMHRV